MPDLNSLREVMQNPEFLRLFSSPETLQVDRFKLLSLEINFNECSISNIGLGMSLLALIGTWVDTQTLSFSCD